MPTWKFFFQQRVPAPLQCDCRESLVLTHGSVQSGHTVPGRQAGKNGHGVGPCVLSLAWLPPQVRENSGNQVIAFAPGNLATSSGPADTHLNSNQGARHQKPFMPHWTSPSERQAAKRQPSLVPGSQSLKEGWWIQADLWPNPSPTITSCTTLTKLVNVWSPIFKTGIIIPLWQNSTGD